MEHPLLLAARSYVERGYAVLPVPAGSKAPVLSGWPSLRLKADELPRYFPPGHNIGILVGEPSGWLVDIDLDCDEALELADEMLPRTDLVTGRPSRPRSHRWYIAVGAVTTQFKDPETGDMLVELRSTGVHTLVGPSVHPDDEVYDLLEGQPTVIDAATLAEDVAALVREVLIKRGRKLPARVAHPAPATPAPARPPQVADERVLARATAYLDRIPGAVSGSGGHSQTYAAATAMVHGFGLDPDVAFGLLKDRYNPRCEPHWTEKELRHKIDDAATKPHDRPYGWLRDQPSPDSSSDTRTAPVTSASDDAPVAEPEAAITPDHPGDLAPDNPGPFPECLLRVPGFISEVMEYNRATAHRWQPTLALAGAIALQAVLAARRVRDERGNRTNLYIVCLAGSGSGKDHARSVNKGILFAAGLTELEGSEDLASDAGLVTAVEAQPGILLQMDEFGRWLRTIGDPKRAPHLFNVISTLMKLYSSAKGVFKGKAYADSGKNKIINQPCVCLLATTAPEHFREALTPESMSDGFMARLLVFETNDLPSRVWAAEQDPPASVIETATWWGDFKPGGNLHHENPRPMVVPTTPAAKALFGALADKADVEMRSPREDVRAIWARVEEKACRLALVYACSRNRERPEIDAEAALWGCELAEYLTRRVLYMAYEYVARTEFDAKQKSVLRVIRSRGGTMSRSQICRATQHFTQREREEVLANLVETGQLEETVHATGGRHKSVFRIPRDTSRSEAG